MIPSLTTNAMLSWSTVFGIFVTIVLIVLLVERELASVGGPRLRSLARSLTVAITALMLTFVGIVAARLVPLLF
jgi:hypothetical protein